MRRARRFLRVPAGSFRLAGDWSSPVALTDSWFHWAGRDPNRTSDYKVYLSPALAELPGALATLLGAAATLPVTGIKAGAEAATLLRPDRVVIYCSQAAEVCVIATALGRALGGIAAHGVPFTAALTPDGLLSWGSDREARWILGRRHRRPASAKIEASDGSKGAGRSWRTMVAAVAALGLVAGRSRPSSVAVALRYLARTGVDPRTFGPAATQLP